VALFLSVHLRLKQEEFADGRVLMSRIVSNQPTVSGLFFDVLGVKALACFMAAAGPAG